MESAIVKEAPAANIGLHPSENLSTLVKMTVTEITARTILRRYKRIDSWFISSMGMNLYRGCTHGCRYCDGQAEQYRLTGEFGKDVEVKTNALDLLNKELNAKRRIPIPGGFVCVGGGVTDTFQPMNEKYALARGALELLLKKRKPVHLLTKSHHVLEHIDLIKQLQTTSAATVSFSFSCVDESVARVLEPGAPSPSKRLEAMKRIKAAGIFCGMFLMPVIPGVSDTEAQLTASLKAAKTVGVDYVVFGTLTLKPGRQHDRFLELVEENWPQHVAGYRKIFTGNRWGAPIMGYQEKIHRRLAPIADELDIPLRIPDTVFGSTVDDTEKVIIILEHLDYLSMMAGRASHFGLAAHSVVQSKTNIHELLPKLASMRGFGSFTIDIVHEILETGTAHQYRKLLHL